MDQKFDVVVAGCGVAGLSAAVTAAERGLTVAVLERASRDDRGGQSRGDRPGRSLQPLAALGHAVHGRVGIGHAHAGLGPEAHEAFELAASFRVEGAGHGRTVGAGGPPRNPSGLVLP